MPHVTHTTTHAFWLLLACLVYDCACNLGRLVPLWLAKRLIGFALWWSWKVTHSRMALSAPDDIRAGWNDLLVDSSILNAEAHVLRLL